MGDKKVSMLLDGGSSMTIIGLNTYNAIKSKLGLILKPSMISCRTASNQPVTVNGESEIGFTIAGNDIKYTFQICSHLISEGIIGRDWFDEHLYTPPMLSFDTKNGEAQIISDFGVREI